MPIMNYTTEIAVEKTTGQIIKALSRRGVTRISTVFDDDGSIAGLAFTMNTDHGVADFALPINVDGVLAAMQKDPKVPRSKQTREQAARVAWRIAQDWLEAQAALIDAELATLDQVMLPYMVDSKGKTIYEIVRSQRLALEGGAR